MFTGLIERTGRLEAIETAAGGAGRIRIGGCRWDTPLIVGESVSVHGACLTVADAGQEWFCCDILRETLARTNLGGKRPGAALNLERALRLGDRLGGHMVTGHVDGVGIVRSIRRAGRDRVISVRFDAALLPLIAEKGSIACDGVSLTVATVVGEVFDVHIVPFTWEHTALCELAEGSSVNIEADIIARYVQRQVAAGPAAGGITLERLRSAGFVSGPE